MNKRVKIVATLGPAVEIRGGKKFGDDGYWGEKLDVEASAQNIAKLIEAGANTFRFNFSHGDHAEQGERMATVKRAEEIAGQKVGFLLDTKGPEIRTELFEGDAKEYSYKTGEKIRVATKQGIKSTRDVIALNVAGALDIYDDVEVGHQVLVDDGKLGLRVFSKDDATREFEVVVENDGIIAKQKGVNIPNTKIPFPALAERDNDDIRFGMECTDGFCFRQNFLAERKSHQLGQPHATASGDRGCDAVSGECLLKFGKQCLRSVPDIRHMPCISPENQLEVWR